LSLPRLLPVAAALLLAVAVALVSPRLVPYDMDEFAAYHPLGCHAFPASAKHNAFRESCGEYDLTPPLLGRALPLRSYTYIGSPPVALYYPLWRAIGEPVSVRVQGALFLLASVALAGRLVGTTFPRALLALLVFPALPGAILFDTGPVGISLVLLLGALLLVDVRAPPSRAVGLCAGAGFLAFLGFWVKPVFAWALPALALRAWRAPSRRGSPAWPRLLAFGLALAAPATVLLLSLTASGRPYLSVLRVADFSAAPEAAVAVASRLAAHLASGASVAPRVLTWPPSPVDLVPLAVAAAVLGLAMRERERRRAVLPWLGAALLTFAATVWSGRAGQAHHLAFSLVFLFLALAAALGPPPASRRLVVGAGLAALALAASLAARWPAVAVHPRSNHARDRLLAWVRASGRDRSSVQLHASWGTYYIAHLFGHESQIVLFSRKFGRDEELVRRARAIATGEKRTVLLLTCEPERVDPQVVESILGPPVATRRFDNWLALDYVPPLAAR
jgi:hypothetical protein